MEASVVDLRYRMKEVLHALDKNQQVTILYRGKVKARLVPTGVRSTLKTQEHPFFGMLKDVSTKGDTPSVAEVMQQLRGGRY